MRETVTPAVPQQFSAVCLAQKLGLPIPTDEQIAVIQAPLQPFLVVAGAGSGKTETMAARVVYLVANALVEPQRVLGLTFTRKAAGQLAERIRARLRALARVGEVDEEVAQWVSGAEPEVSTYHAFAGRVIGEYGPLVGVEPSSRVLTPASAWQLARQLVGRWEHDLETDASPDRVTETLLALAGGLADHLRTPTELADYLDTMIARITKAPPTSRQKGPLMKELADRVKNLQQRRWVLPLVLAFSAAKRQQGVVDFADQMQLAAQLVVGQPSIGVALRLRYPVVLLDEYQDTGHAQRVILRSIFGMDGHPVTAVGDPVQSIYTWRGASASNLVRFGADFPLRSGAPAPRLTLLTSFRNPPEVLTLANAVSSSIRRDVEGLSPRPGAPGGRIAFGLFDTIGGENDWLADQLADRWAAASGAGRTAPSTAVLMRRRRDMDELAQALQDRGLPVEVVGLGGLLQEPEVADLVAMLHLLVDPNSGASALRVLTGVRWRLGAADLAALALRAQRLAGRRSVGGARTAGAETVTADRDATSPAAANTIVSVRAAMAQAATGADDAEDVLSLVDALADPGPENAFSPIGFSRISRLGAELGELRHRLAQPLPDLVADVERTICLDVEVAVAGPQGRAHLDAFAQVVDDFAEFGGGVVELLDFLTAAQQREEGLAPGEVEVSDDRIQILTVHAAKGLEWDIVAVPHLSAGVFPSERASSWLTDASQLPPDLRGDIDDVPALRLPDDGDQAAVARALKEHLAALKVWQFEEERRLAYVALTRSQKELLFSAHQWGATGIKVRGPGEFLTELQQICAGPDLGIGPDCWAPDPVDGAQNPLTASPRSALWPRDALADKRIQVRAGADAVLAAIARSAVGEQPDPEQRSESEPDPFGWSADVTALLAERRSSRVSLIDVDLPSTVSVSALVDLATDPMVLASRIRRPVPMPPAPQARRGTAFHLWLEHRFSGEALLGLDELPGADDRDAAADEQLKTLKAAFLQSSWADRSPVRVEVPFATTIGPLGVRGRIDAVFVDPDGGYTVVDWKTGRRPSARHAAAVSVQLAAYRLAWSQLAGVPLERVRAAFHFVASRFTLAPVDLLDAAGLAELIQSATSGP